jgi:hypothetical protein
MTAYIALGNARTDEAKAALNGIMKDEQAPFVDRTRAILSLVDRRDVGPSLAHYLSDKATKISSGETKSERLLARQAMLAVGTMSGMRPEDPQLKDIAVGSIERGIEANAHPMSRRPVYGALANVGDPALLRLVREIPDHPDADMRKSAAAVVRRMPPAETADFVGRWLDREQNWRVKDVLYRTVERQTFDAGKHPGERVLAHAIDDLKQKPGPMTRKALIRILGRGLEQMDEDELGIEETLLEMIPYEVAERSGLYGVIAEQIDDGDKLEGAVKTALARLRDNRSGGADTPARPELRRGNPAGTAIQKGRNGKVRAQ